MKKIVQNRTVSRSSKLTFQSGSNREFEYGFATTEKEFTTKDTEKGAEGTERGAEGTERNSGLVAQSARTTTTEGAVGSEQRSER
jgi:hypothetical protein